MLGFKVAASNSLAKFNLVDQVIDEFTDNTGINTTASLNETLSGSGAPKYYSGSSYSTTTTTGQTYSYTGNDTTIAVANGQTVTGTVECWGAGGIRLISRRNLVTGYDCKVVVPMYPEV